VRLWTAGPSPWDTFATSAIEGTGAPALRVSSHCRWFAPRQLRPYHAKVPRKLKLPLIKLLFLPALILLCSPAQSQQKNDVASVPFSPAPYRVGERLTYNVSFSHFISAAHIELFVAGRGIFFDREAIVLKAHVETTGVVNAALYAINNDYTSYVDPATGLPFRAQQVIREAGRNADTASDYNQPAGTAAIPGTVRMGEFPGTYEMISAIYRARSLPLVEGSYYLTVQAEGQAYQAELKVTGREVVKTNVGSFNTVVTRLNIKGAKINDYRFHIYFSDDERHVPVLVTARHPAGEIRAELAGSQLTAVAPVAQPTAPPNPVVTPTPRRPPLAGAPLPSGNDELPADLPFKVGEQLNFQVYIATGTQPLGTASFQVRPRARYFNRDGLLLTVKAQTTNAAQRVFFANDQINSYVDPLTLLPFRTELNLVEGARRLNRTWSIDQNRGNAIGDNGDRVDLPVGTFDYVSLLYAVRSLDLSPQKRHAVSLMVNDKSKTLFITSQRRETIEIGGQKIPAVLLSLTTDDPESDKFQLRAWVSTDNRRLPLRLTAVTQIGPLRADLVIIPVTHQ
jgi:uncharacterized protein DUF3108